jgi:hypothetical protein
MLNRDAIRQWGVISCCGMLQLACGGRAVDVRGSADSGDAPPAQTGGSGGSGGTTALGQDAMAQDSGVGGMDGGNGHIVPGGVVRCGAHDENRGDDCTGIDKIALLDPMVSALTDGSIVIGEFSSFHVWVRNNDDREHHDVCVGVIVETPGIELSEDTYTTNPTWAGLFYPGNTVILSPAYFAVLDVEPGTVARFTAWSGFEGTNCRGPTASVDALVKQWK